MTTVDHRAPTAAHRGDHAAFGAFVRRVLRAYGRRLHDADPEDLADLLAMRDAVDAAIRAAVEGMRAQGRSWGEIGTACGTTRQAAQQRWGASTRH